MRAQIHYLSCRYSRFDYTLNIYCLHLEVSWDWGAGSLRQVDHVLSVSLEVKRVVSHRKYSGWQKSHLGRFLCLLGVPDWLHLGEVGAVLVLGGLVSLPSLVSPPDSNQQGCPPAGLERRKKDEKVQHNHSAILTLIRGDTRRGSARTISQI